MKKYCLDTSGFSNPLEHMPQDLHTTLWQKVMETVCAGIFAVTPEIYDELERLPGAIGDCVKSNRDLLRLEIGGSWEWQEYLEHAKRMQVGYREFISEYNGNRKGTIGLNDVSIIALARTMSLPLVNMEVITRQPSLTRRRIPDVCLLEGIEPLTFSSFLRREAITA